MTHSQRAQQRINDSTSSPRAPGRRFAQFAALCLLLSWLPWTVLGLLDVNISHGAGQIVFGLAASGPSLAALVLWLRRPNERIRGAGRTTWYAVMAGLLLGGAAPAISGLVLHAGNLPSVGTHIASLVAGMGGPVLFFAFIMTSGPLSEEFGWRGYVQPRLRQRLGPIRTALVLGSCWGIWHLPLFLLPGTGQHQIGLPTIGGLCFFISVISLTFVILFVSERLRGGVWAAVAAHAGFNAMDGSLMPSAGSTGALLEAGILIILALGSALMLRRQPSSPRP